MRPARPSRRPDDATVARREAARRQVDDCNARLRRYRAVLEAGADPIVIAGWIREVEGERLAAERELGAAVSQDKLTKAQVKALVGGLRDVVEALTEADPADKTAIYDELGLTLTYHPGERRAVVESRPCSNGCVGGAFGAPSTPVLRGELVVGA